MILLTVKYVITIDKFKQRLFEKFGNKIKICEPSFIDMRSPAFFTCSKGHTTVKRPYNALNQLTHCTTCYHEDKRVAYKTFVEKAKVVHNNKYEYLDEPKDYFGRHTYIKYICPQHGEVNQLAHFHLRGHGCNNCSKYQSVAEKEICQFLSDNGIGNIQTNRKILNGQEIDILINNDIGIEYNGIYFHREGLVKTNYKDVEKNKKYHFLKTDLALKNNIDLIQIFEDDFINSKNIVLNTLLYKIGISQNIKIPAKKTTVKKIYEADSKSFMVNNTHIKYNNSNLFYGIFYDDNLIGILNFLDNQITNFIIKENIILQGGFSKLLNFYIREYNPTEIFVKVDREWSPNPMKNVYYKCGFDLIETLPQDYYYLNTKGSNTFKRIKKEILKEELNFNNENEIEVIKTNNYDRIWDCGYYLFRLDLTKKISYKNIQKNNVIITDNKFKPYKNIKDDILDKQVFKLVEEGKLMKDITSILNINKRVLNRSYERLKLQRRRFEFTKDIKNLIINSYKNAVPIHEITNQVNNIIKPAVTRGKIVNFLEVIGLKNKEDKILANNSKYNNPFFIKNLDEQVLLLVKENLTMKEICQKLKLTIFYVTASFDRLKINSQKSEFIDEVKHDILLYRKNGKTLDFIVKHLNNTYLGYFSKHKVREFLKKQ